MPVPIVTVEIAEPRQDPPPELSAVLAAACNDALRRGRCVLAEPVSEASPSSPGPAPRAVIVWSERGARVDVWVAGDQGVEKRTRELEFAEGQPAVEQWRSVGFVTGTLANPRGSEDFTAAPRPSPEKENEAGADRRAPTESAAEAPVAAADRPSSAWIPERGYRPRIWFEAGPITGPGFEGGAWRLGGFFGLGYAVRASFVQASLGYSAPPEDGSGLAARWITPALGVGHALFDSSLGLSVRVRTELLLEHTFVSISTPAAPLGDSGGHWAPGLRLGGDVGFDPVPGLGLFLGADVAAFIGRVHVDVGGTRTATTPAFRPSLLGGARLTLPLSGASPRTSARR